MEYLGRVHGVTLRDKEHTSEIRKSRNVKPPNRGIPATLIRSCVQNAVGKMDETRPAGYTHGKAAQRSSKDRVA